MAVRAARRAAVAAVFGVALLIGAAPCPVPAASADVPVARVDSALARSAAYMLSKQSADGAWRSRTYGLLKDGSSLTPLVLSALFFLPQGGPAVRPAYRKGVAYLRTMVGSDGRITDPGDGLSYPVLTAASASRVVVLEQRTPVNLRAQQAWLAYLRARQLTRNLGWTHGDVEFGGWGFAMGVPRKPASGHARGLLVESNMVATIFGIAAMRSGRVPAGDPGYGDALMFVKRCQNLAERAEDTDPRFDDGGFCFIPDDAVQNKAGIAGRDRLGRTRFHSYGSMSADGVRALLRCGLPPSHPRVVAGRLWLERDFRVDHHPGRYVRDREVLRDATYYYWCWSVAHAFLALDAREIETPTGKVRWAEAMATELMRRQRVDGSWANRYTDAKEDDPLVATPWAAAALTICRQVMTGDEKALTARARM